MRVVFLEDVEGVAQGGDVKIVKNGFARNYLIPKRLAVPSNREALRKVDTLKQEADQTRLKTLADLKVLGELLDGSRVDVEMRAGASGRLYGSVTNAIVAAELSGLTDREIDRRTVEIDEPIRRVGSYNVRVRLHPDVDASIMVLVHPTGSDADEYLAGIEAAAADEAARNVERAKEAEDAEETAESESEGESPEETPAAE
jgi:large subunit ribosomal protein L9